MQDTRDCMEVFSKHMPRIFDAIIENSRLLRVVGTLFGSPIVGPTFAQVRLQSCPAYVSYFSPVPWKWPNCRKMRRLSHGFTGPAALFDP